MVSIATMTNASDPASSPPPATSAPLQANFPSLYLSLPLSTTKLTGKNYLTWSQFMLVVLKANTAIRFVQYFKNPPKFLTEFDRIM
ncbi:hypothetical protein Lal_00031650 [Lupinus albus]|nr:hypothetical protein Lal_00031650 [Lupinus albus]